MLKLVAVYVWNKPRYTTEPAGRMAERAKYLRTGPPYTGNDCACYAYYILGRKRAPETDPLEL